MRIGIFGGTFNPPHSGHKKLALEFKGRLSLDLLLIIPTHIPPHKEPHQLAGDEDRMNMCRLCFDEKSILVSDIEIKRDGRSYTVDTLREIKKIYPDDEIYFLMGSDMLLSFHTWREPLEITSLAHICTASRHHDETKELENYIDRYFSDIKSRFTVFDFEPIDVSSTEIRAGKKFDLLPEKVADYIKERGLYN